MFKPPPYAVLPSEKKEPPARSFAYDYCLAIYGLFEGVLHQKPRRRSHITKETFSFIAPDKKDTAASGSPPVAVSKKDMPPLLRREPLNIKALPQVNALLAVGAEQVRDVNDVNEFLSDVLCGRYAAVELALKQNPQLVMWDRRPAKNPIGMVFEGFTGFQAALHNYDRYMQQLFVVYLPADVIQAQLNEVEVNGQYYNPEPLFNAYKEYIALCERDASVQERKKCWIEKVGSAQAKMPEHFLFEFLRFFKIFPARTKETIQKDLLDTPKKSALVVYEKRFPLLLAKSEHFSGDKQSIMLGENAALTRGEGMMDEPPSMESVQADLWFVETLLATRKTQQQALVKTIQSADFLQPQAASAQSGPA